MSVVRLAGLIAVVLWPAVTRAQGYPVRAIRLVVASSPGSGVDIVARIMAQRMSETLGVQMVIDNRPGAGGGHRFAGGPDTTDVRQHHRRRAAYDAVVWPAGACAHAAGYHQQTQRRVDNVRARHMRDKLAVEGAEPAPGTAAEFGKHLAREVAIWAKIVKIAGVQ